MLIFLEDERLKPLAYSVYFLVHRYIKRMVSQEPCTLPIMPLDKHILVQSIITSHCSG